MPMKGGKSRAASQREASRRAEAEREAAEAAAKRQRTLCALCTEVLTEPRALVECGGGGHEYHHGCLSRLV